MNAIETENLYKSFGATRAVRGLTMQVPEGSIYGLIGRNASGKTTTLRMLAGVLMPDKGEAKICGSPRHGATEKQRARLAYVSQTQKLYKKFTALDHADCIASMYPNWDQAFLESLCRRFGVPLDRPLGSLSGGQLRMTAVALAFAARTDVLLLDEPAAGLDPVSRRKLMGEIAGIIADGMGRCTILLSTHILADIERIADTIGIIDKGRMMLSGSLDALLERNRRVQIVFPGTAVPEEFSLPGEKKRTCRGPVYTALAKVPEKPAPPSLGLPEGARVQIASLGLEDLFIELFDDITSFHE